MQRTHKQNKALHLYTKHLAQQMADAGLDLRHEIRVEITPTPENIKSIIIHGVMKALFPDKTSTTQLETEEIDLLYKNVNRMTAERWGISIEFPNSEEV